MLRESSCYAPTRTVLKIVKAKQEMRFQVLILWCWMTLGQAFNLHFPYVHKWFQNFWQKQCCKNSLLLKKNTVFEKYLLPRFSNNLQTSFIHTAETLEMRKQNIWLVIHLTQPVQPTSHPGGSEKAKEPYTQVFTSGVTLNYWRNLGWVPVASWPSESSGIG